MVEINTKNRVITDIRIPFNSVVVLILQIFLAHLLIGIIVAIFMFLFMGNWGAWFIL